MLPQIPKSMIIVSWFSKIYQMKRFKVLKSIARDIKRYLKESKFTKMKTSLSQAKLLSRTN